MSIMQPGNFYYKFHFKQPLWWNSCSFMEGADLKFALMVNMGSHTEENSHPSIYLMQDHFFKLSLHFSQSHHSRLVLIAYVKDVFIWSL